MRSLYDAVVFDLGGVMIDWNPRHLYRSIFDDEAAMERFLAEICTPAWNHSMDAGRPFAEGIADLVAQHPEWEPQIRAWRLRWSEMLRGEYDDCVALMRELKAGGVRVYALSNWSAETFGETRARFPFLAEFDGILISGEAGCAKPDPAIFQAFLDRFGLDPSRCLFLDDTPGNVRAAEEAGMAAIRYEGVPRLREDLAGRGLPVSIQGS